MPYPVDWGAVVKSMREIGMTMVVIQQTEYKQAHVQVKLRNAYKQRKVLLDSKIDVQRSSGIPITVSRFNRVPAQAGEQPRPLFRRSRRVVPVRFNGGGPNDRQEIHSNHRTIHHLAG